MQHVGLIIRSDGTVPIDEGHPYRSAILEALRSEGHELEHSSGCDHHKGHACSCSPKIKDWDANVGRS